MDVSGAEVDETYSTRRELVLHLVVALAVGIVFHSVLAHPTRMLYSPYSDILSQHHPFRHLLVESLRERQRFPLWNATAFAGMPLVGDPQSGLFYPPNWLHAILPADSTVLLFGPLVVLHLLVGGWGMLWWLRGRGFGSLARLVGAGCFVFCGKWFHHVVVPGHVIFLPLVWLPWQCGLIDRLWDRPSLRRVATLALITAVAITGYHPQLLFYSQLMLVGYALSAGIGRSTRQWRVSLGWLTLAAGLGLALAAIHLVPILDAVGKDLTVRASGMPYEIASRHSLTFEGYVNLLFPSRVAKGWEYTSYFGVLAGALALFGWVRREGRARAVFFLLVIVLSLWFALGANASLHRLIHEHVPGFGLFRIPSRALLLFGAPIGYLAASGFSSLCQAPPSSTKSLLAVALVVATGWLPLRDHSLEALFAAAALSVPLLTQAPWGPRGRLVLGPVVLALLFAEQVHYAEPLVKTRTVEETLGRHPLIELMRGPLGRERTLAINYGRRGMFTSLPITYSSPARIERLRGFNPLIPRSTVRYLLAGVAREPELKWPFGTGIRNFAIADRKYLDLLNVRWAVTNEPIDVEGLTLHETFDDLKVYHFAMKTHELSTMSKTYLYENKQVLPRAFLVRRATLVDSVEQAIDGIADLDPKREVLVEEGALVGAFPGGYQPVAIDHRGDELLLSFDAGAGGYLFLSEMWYPGWRAFDGGEPIEVHRGNGVFLFVKVGPGKHELRFRYLPTSYRVGKWITGVALLLTAFLLLRPTRPRPVH